MAYGEKNTLLISPQQSFGTATSSWVSIPLINETLFHNRTRLVPTGMRGRHEASPSIEGIGFIEGEFSFEPQGENIAHLFRAVLGQASSTIVDSHTLWRFVPTQTDWSTDSALPPFTMQVYNDVTETVSDAFQLVDCVIPQIVIDQAPEETMKVTVSVLGKTTNRMLKATPSFFGSDPFTWDQSSISIAAAANSDMENYSLTINTNVEGVSLLTAEKKWSKYKRASGSFREFLLNGTLNFDNLTEWDKFKQGTAQRFLITVKGNTAIGSGYTSTMQFDFPTAKYDTYEIPADGTGRMSASFAAVGEFDTTSSYAFMPTVTTTITNYSP